MGKKAKLVPYQLKRNWNRNQSQREEVKTNIVVEPIEVSIEPVEQPVEEVIKPKAKRAIKNNNIIIEDIKPVEPVEEVEPEPVEESKNIKL